MPIFPDQITGKQEQAVEAVLQARIRRTVGAGEISHGFYTELHRNTVDPTVFDLLKRL